MKNARLAMGLSALLAAGLFAGCTTARTDTASRSDTTMSAATTTGASATATTVDSSAQATYQDRGAPTSPQSSHSAATASGSSSTGMGHSAADMKTMCDMHQRVMKAKTDAEREAALDANVRAMAPAEKQKYIDMMHQHCK